LGINYYDQLTPEQMELLYSAVDQVQNIDTKTSDSNEHDERQVSSGHVLSQDVTDKTVSAGALYSNSIYSVVNWSEKFIPKLSFPVLNNALSVDSAQGSVSILKIVLIILLSISDIEPLL
jgi:CMP-N-acetylneuraminic acid synthetase